MPNPRYSKYCDNSSGSVVSAGEAPAWSRFLATPLLPPCLPLSGSTGGIQADSPDGDYKGFDAFLLLLEDGKSPPDRERGS